MVGIDLLVDLQIEIALLVAGRKDETDLRTDADDARLEIAEYGAGAAVAGDLLIDIADQPEMHLLGDEVRQSRVEVGVNAVLVLQVGILEIVGEAGDAGELPTGVRIEIGVAAAGVDRPVPEAEIDDARTVTAMT